MADVYKFKVRLCELENAMWRDIEKTSDTSEPKLPYAVYETKKNTTKIKTKILLKRRLLYE